MKSGKFAALIAGLAAGTVLGLLFAPEKGTDTRDKINDSLKDLADALKERAAEQFEALNDLKERLISSVVSKVDEAEDEVDDIIEEHA